jgi:hypothetical protein
MKQLLIILSLFLTFSISTIAQNNPTKKTTPATQSRSAKSGKYVTKSYADKHPSTTYTTPKK